MRRSIPVKFVVLLTLVLTPAAGEDHALKLTGAVPANVYLAVHGRHNPERDYQAPYIARIIDTVRETRLLERALVAVRERLPDARRERAMELLEEIKTATEPIDLRALLTCQEVIYAQRMESFRISGHHEEVRSAFTSQHLLMLRLTSNQAADYHRGILNLFDVMKSYLQDHITIETKTIENHPSKVTLLSSRHVPPFRPAVACVDDVILLSSSADFLRDSLETLLSDGSDSKFDDSRVVEALKHLPEPEDALVVYDGRTQFQQMRAMVDMIHKQAGGQPEAERWVQFTNTIFDEVAIIDLLVSVEFTEDNLNRVETLGRLLPKVADRLLTEMLSGGEQFDEWHRWVPADATAYSLSTGANFHPAYERIIQIIRERIPELQQPLERFERWQREIDLHLDVDLLQTFSGECVSVTLPATPDSNRDRKEAVWATRCHQPARTRWLLERLVRQLNQYPVVQAQQLRLVDCEELEGFQQISAMMCTLFGIRPVIGFHEGWMLIGTSPEAVQRVFDCRAGEAGSITETEEFQQLRLEIEGPVQSVRYVNMAEQIRQVSEACQGAGAVMPMIMSLIKANLSAEQDVDQLEKLIPFQIVAEVLSDVGKIIGQFDFFEANLKVIQDGPEPGTWRERSVTRIRRAQAEVTGL